MRPPGSVKSENFPIRGTFFSSTWILPPAATIQSEAFRVSEEIRGKADAEATSIYASAYNQSRQAVDLYKFLRTMESFEKSLDENTSIILSTKSDFFRYLNSLD